MSLLRYPLLRRCAVHARIHPAVSIHGFVCPHVLTESVSRNTTQLHAEADVRDWSCMQLVP
jgi:hypothetical protein